MIATDLRTGKQTGTVSLGASCTPEELQSNGTLRYWNCPEQGQAGVQDPAAGDLTTPDGTYIWTLTAAPADGQGAPVTVSGALVISGS
ncbi:hypothetical protein [Streptomyces sp. ME19-01-6]|uniref:hypothetical protein n=1 Tax=Streptomyces sp. ME19-01-6 TaxID=3028686 RepID=UPI0029B55060|nr:hypothetical protein [Streptomyces sp. ME19-01-6]MDX3224997.1 hypothetical protein [Streptomyces sp. ME19-01-6]